MKMKKTLTTVIFFGAVSLSAGLVIAYDLPTRGPIPFDTWDADGSGTIEEQEFNTIRTQRLELLEATTHMGRNTANAPTFAQIDADDDGRITAEELTAMQQAQGMRRTMGRNHHGPGSGMQGNMGLRYQSMDTETKAKYDAFFADTTQLRKEIMVKRAEKRAVMQSTDPDPDQAAQLTRELLELRSQMMAKAEEAGIDYGPGNGRGCGHGGKRHGAHVNR